VGKWRRERKVEEGERKEVEGHGAAVEEGKKEKNSKTILILL